MASELHFSGSEGQVTDINGEFVVVTGLVDAFLAFRLDFSSGTAVFGSFGGSLSLFGKGLGLGDLDGTVHMGAFGLLESLVEGSFVFELDVSKSAGTFLEVNDQLHFGTFGKCVNKVFDVLFGGLPAEICESDFE